jgi:hypothetical protein
MTGPFRTVPTDTLPPRIRAAFEVAHMLNTHRRPVYGPFGGQSGDCPIADNDLTSQQQALENVALDAIRNYITGEDGFGGSPYEHFTRPQEGDSGASELEPVT